MTPALTAKRRRRKTWQANRDGLRQGIADRSSASCCWRVLWRRSGGILFSCHTGLYRGVRWRFDGLDRGCGVNFPPRAVRHEEGTEGCWRCLPARRTSWRLEAKTEGGVKEVKEKKMQWMRQCPTPKEEKVLWMLVGRSGRCRKAGRRLGLCFF